MDIVDRTGLIVYIHHGDQPSIFPDCSLNSVCCNYAFLVWPDISDIKLVFGQHFRSPKNGVMLNCRNNNVFLAKFGQLVPKPLEHCVVAFASTGCKNHMLRRTVKQTCCLLSGVLNCGSSRLSELVQRAGIPIFVRQVRHHCVENLRRNSCGRRRIKINHWNHRPHFFL